MAKSKSPFIKKYRNYNIVDRRLIDLFWGGNLKINEDIVKEKLSSFTFDLSKPYQNAFVTAYNDIDWSKNPTSWFFPIDRDIVPEFRQVCFDIFNVSEEDKNLIKKEDF